MAATSTTALPKNTTTTFNPVTMAMTTAKQETATATTPSPREIIIDAGSSSEDASIISGSIRVFGKTLSDIQETDSVNLNPRIFQFHRWGGSFAYTFEGFLPFQPPQITLGFAETYSPNCAPNNRLFGILIINVLEISTMDVYSKAGACFTPHLETFIGTAAADGRVTISFRRIKEDAMISYIKVTAQLS